MKQDSPVRVLIGLVAVCAIIGVLWSGYRNYSKPAPVVKKKTFYQEETIFIVSKGFYGGVSEGTAFDGVPSSDAHKFFFMTDDGEQYFTSRFEYDKFPREKLKKHHRVMMQIDSNGDKFIRLVKEENEN